MLTKQGLDMIYNTGPGYTGQGRTVLQFARQDLAILDNAVSNYDLHGRNWLYLTRQGLAMIYKAGPGYT